MLPNLRPEIVTSPHRALFGVLLLTTVTALLSSCGFYLRTTNLGSYLSAVNMDAAQLPLMERELKRVFALNDIILTESKSAELSLRLNEYEFQKSTSLVVPQEGLIEYELILQATFTLWFEGNQESAEEITFSKAGRVRVHPNQLLSTSAEEQTVRTELIEGVINNFVQTLYLRLASTPATD